MLQFRFVLLPFRSPILEADEVGYRHQGRVLRLGVDDRRGLGFRGVRPHSRSFALLAFGGDSLIERISGFAVLSHLRRNMAGSEILDRRTELLATGLLFALIPVIGLGAVYSYA